MVQVPRRGRLVAEDPAASIVIPVLERVDLLIPCLDSIARLEAAPAHEVIVVANGTPAPGVARLADRDDIVLLRSPVNLGFAAGCNWAARFAQGDFLVLLNDDTEVEPGWLAALVGAARSDEGIGVVGSRLLDPDGTLQEVGGVLWRDGGTLRIGRGLPAGSTAYPGVRDVDYCSGCGLLVRRAAFEEVGGLDEGYFPAYHEDVDLCLALRARGYRVVCTADAVVRHHQGASTGAAFRAFAAARNGRRFVAKWAETLGDYEPPPGTRVLDQAINAALARTAARPLAARPGARRRRRHRPSPPTELEALEAQRDALLAELRLKDAYVAELAAGSPAMEAELRHLRLEHAKLERLRNLARRLPGGRGLARWLSRRIAAR